MKDKTAIKYRPESSKLSRQYIALLNQIVDLCAQRTQVFLKQYLQIEAKVQWQEVEVKPFRAFASSLPASCSIHVLEGNEGQDYSLLVQNVEIASAMVERMLGGSKQGTVDIKFTSIETAILGKTANLLLQEFERVFADIVPISWAIFRHETSPTLASVMSEKEDVLIMRFNISGEIPEGEMHLCLSARDVIPYLEKSKVSKQSPERRVNNEDVRQHLQKVSLPVSVRLGEANLNYGELLELRPGDVIRLNQSFNYAALLCIETTPKFIGKIGKNKTNWAFLIETEGDRYEF